jgi:threonine aldolase
MTRTIDLRSDTFTVPSPAMREAIARAEVGDDVWGEDPTVITLQERVADLLGKEAALYVPSGSMANLISLLLHTRPGDEVLLGWGSHCISYESGAGAAVAGCMFKVIGTGGQFTAQEVGEAICQAEDPHFAPTTLVWLENTHNMGGGRIFPQDQVEAIASLAHQRGLAVHLDGARLLNAAVASGRPARELVAAVDSTSICLSKGLGAPVGSVLAGEAALIRRARRFRKMLGGAMRQVGILAAAGLYALEHNVERLAEDHANARLLLEGLVELASVRLEPRHVQTNIIIFELDHPSLDAAGLIDACATQGLLLCPAGPGRIRVVTHLDVSRDDCHRAVEIIRGVLG